MDLVPVIDIARWEHGQAGDRQAIADALATACSTVGFLQVTGHGVPADVVEGLRRACDDLFALPLAEKLPLVPADPEINRGYAAKGSESLSYSIGEQRPPDLFEAFNVGVDWTEHDVETYRSQPKTFAPNVWPDVPGFRPAIEAYFAAAQALAHRLTAIAATTLGLPADFFVGRTDRSIDVLRMIHYERQPGEPEPSEGQMRMGAHTDYGIMTILQADPVPGLQIVDPAGDWYDVLPLADGFVVNLGDALAVWTNDHWRSTLHRVVPPPNDATGGIVRRSHAFFHDGNADALIECLPGCSGPEDPPRYEAVTIGDHITDKLLGPRTGSAVETVQTVGGRRT